MKMFFDYKHRKIRLTEERYVHILSHAELKDHFDWIENALHNPEEVRSSSTDDSVELFYKYHPKTLVGSKWLCVVVKYLHRDAFIVTAYLTDKIKKGIKLCQKENL